MDDAVTAKNSSDRDSLEERVKTLGSEKARLSTIFYMYETFSSVHGLEQLVDTTLSLIMDFYGGLNICLYYQLVDAWYMVDLSRQARAVDVSDDPQLLEIINGKSYLNVPFEEQPDSRLRDYKLPKGAQQRTLLFPVEFDGDVIGIIRIEGIWLHDQRFVKDLPVFLKYVGMSLNHELYNYHDLKDTYDELRSTNRKLEQAREKQARSLHEKTVLLKEIHHRVKNNLQVVSSMINLQSEIPENRHSLELLQMTGARVRTMGLIHEKLYQSDDFSKIGFTDYIRSLVNQLIRSYNTDGIPFETELDAGRLQLNIDTAIPCGLIINEAVSNSLKYAFKGRTAGKLKVTLVRLKNRNYRMVIGDDGCGLPADVGPDGKHGLGVSLIGMLADQLRGDVKIERTGGTAYTLTFKGL